MKPTLRKHFLESQKDWHDVVTFVLPAARECLPVQETLEFSLAELVFGQNICDPLKLLKEQLLLPEGGVGHTIPKTQCTPSESLHFGQHCSGRG